MPFSFNVYLEMAHRLADVAGSHTLTHFRNANTVENKHDEDFDPVTTADKAAEAAMRAMVATEFPDHGILGEEFGETNIDADYVWTFDPIDGTRAYILGMPMWGTLIGLQYQGKPILGVMDQPYIGERFWNDEDAAWYRGPQHSIMRCHTRTNVRLDEALLTASAPDMFQGDIERGFQMLKHQVRMQRFGGDCYAYCMLAMGHIDIVAEAKLKPFDIIPLVPIVEKAGGIVTSWQGGSPLEGGACVACGNPELLPQVLSYLQTKERRGAQS